VNDRRVGKDMVDSAPIEMKVLTSGAHSSDLLDTKGRHANGAIHEVCEPLLDGSSQNAARRRDPESEPQQGSPNSRLPLT